MEVQAHGFTIDRNAHRVLRAGLDPVKLHSATESTKAISFNLLHKDCGSRLKQQYFCVKEEVPVAARTW
jgi:non-homologous end joining protein Ku